MAGRAEVGTRRGREAGRLTLASRGGIPATPLTAVQSRASDLSSLCLSFLIYGMATVAVLIHRVGVKINRGNTCKALKTVPGTWQELSR